MNGQPPPTDPYLHDQLARRSGGRLPEGLIGEVMSALDGVPVEKPRRLVVSSALWRAPRIVAAGAGLALAAVLAVALVAVPLLRTPPAGGPSASLAGYPADRALTTAELARIMAGPALPTNTALVAAVTIEARTDVCPMNSRPTVGVVEGMDSQVCVMGAGVSDYLTTASVTGTFAFRYVAPGYLGLLGEIRPASSSRLAFQVADEWPTGGQTLLVEGWLGASGPPDGMAISCALTPTVGDPLDPDGPDCPYDNWLSDDGTPPGGGTSAGSAEPSADSLSLRGHARYVEAGGMRLADSIDHSAPAYGAYVVRIQTSECKGSAVRISNPCWHVLARVPEIATPQPATPSPSAESPDHPVQPLGLLAPGNKAFSMSQLADAMSADADHLAGRTVVVEAPFGSGITCNGSSCGILKDLRESSGTWAVRIGSDGLFEILGPLALAPDGTLIRKVALWWSASDAARPDQDHLIVVDEWLDGGADFACVTGASASPACGTARGSALLDVLSSQSGELIVQSDAYGAFVGWPASGEPDMVHGLFLILYADDAQALLLARFDVAVSPATPTPSPSPSLAPGAALPGFVGAGGRPLTLDELAGVWADAPKDMIAIVKGPVPGVLPCTVGSGADKPTQVCVVTPDIAGDGYWAVQVSADGHITLLNELSLLNGQVSISADDLLPVKERGASDLVDQYSGDLMVVSGLLRCTTQNQDWLNGVDYGLELEGATCDKVEGAASNDLPKAYYLVRIGRPSILLAPLTLVGK
jgi:hypothetical protein